LFKAVKRLAELRTAGLRMIPCVTHCAAALSCL
jgi:hypothetical protein